MTILNSVRAALVGFFALVCFAAPARAQQVIEGSDPVAPAFAGQTRAPLAPKSPRFEVSEFVTSLTRPWAMAHMPDGNMRRLIADGTPPEVVADAIRRFLGPS